jgi:hypothetical protein
MGMDKLPASKEVHHNCMTRACFPPTDFHLVIVDAILTPYMYQTHANKGKRRRRAA